MFSKPETTSPASWFYTICLLFVLLTLLAWQDWMLISGEVNIQKEVSQYSETLGSLG